MREVSETRKKKKIQGRRVKVVGVGGGGCNAVSSMMKSADFHVDFAVINTDPTDFKDCDVSEKLLIGSEESSLRGTGGNRDLGIKAVKEYQKEVENVINGVNLLFIVAGLGGGTGTGAAPEIARIAKKLRIPTVAIVTLPFEYEGPERVQRALEGMEELKAAADILFTISNDKLSDVVGDDATFGDAMNKVNEVMHSAVKAIIDSVRSNDDTVLNYDRISELFEGDGFEETRSFFTVSQR